MNKFAKIAMLASALVIPGVANAAPADGNYSGSVTVTKGLTLFCTLSATVSGGGTSVSGLALSGPLCTSVTFNNQPYAATSTGTTSGTFTIVNVDVNTITAGGCYGNAVGSYSGNTISLAASIPPKSAGTGNCGINGTITKL